MDISGDSCLSPLCIWQSICCSRDHLLSCQVGCSRAVAGDYPGRCRRSSLVGSWLTRTGRPPMRVPEFRSLFDSSLTSSDGYAGQFCTRLPSTIGATASRCLEWGSVFGARTKALLARQTAGVSAGKLVRRDREVREAPATRTSRRRSHGRRVAGRLRGVRRDHVDETGIRGQPLGI